MGILLSTWIFGGAALLLALLALGFLVWPLRRQPAQQAISRRDANIALYEERVHELDKSVGLGEMSAEDAELQKTEAGKHLLQDTNSEINTADTKEGGRWLYGLAVIALPLSAVFFYLNGDGWRLINADDKSPPWDFIIHRAQEKLKQNPADIETQTFLARSYRALERFPESTSAYAELNSLTKHANPDFLVEEGEMLAMVSEGSLQGRAKELFAKALAADPKHGRALWYAGLAALQGGDESAAIKHWQLLAQMELPDSFRLVLTRQLKKLNADVPDAPIAATGSVVIRVKVAVDSKLIENLPPATTVFVYAKASGGPARPLAAQRITLQDLPMTVELNDSMQMGGGPGLSDFESWTIYARVSANADVKATKGDPMGAIELTRSDALAEKPLIINSRWSD